MNSIFSWPLRLYIALMFFTAGSMKVMFGFRAPDWFKGLDFPWPQSWLPVDVNWVMAGYGEVILSLLLLTPLASWAAIGLIYICFVAVYTSHFDMGFAGWNDPEDGFKIPLMYALMLVSLIRPSQMQEQFRSIFKRG